MTESLAKTDKQSGWAHSSSHERDRFSSTEGGILCFALVKRGGTALAFRTREAALAARQDVSDIVREIYEGDEL